jgi:hypothetical protein
MKKKLIVLSVLSALSILGQAAPAYANGHKVVHKQPIHTLTYGAAHRSASHYALTLGKSFAPGDQIGTFEGSGADSCDRENRLRFDCVVFDYFQQPDYSYNLCTVELNVFTTDRRFRIITVKPFVKTVDCQNVGGLVLGN